MFPTNDIPRSPRVIAIIPARMGSSRFPGKPMALIHGLPMVGHVYFRTCRAKRLSGTYVATCDREIYDFVLSIGGKAVMTSDKHQRCSDRTAEAMLHIEQSEGLPIDIVTMVQGDEPMVEPESIDCGIHAMAEDPAIKVSCLMAPIKSMETFGDINQVKVVTDRKGNALYFSRAPIPSVSRAGGSVPMFRQFCIISFRRDYLLRFNALAPTPLEGIESVDLNRCLEHGDPVKMIPVESAGLSVDTPEDLEAVVRATASDPLTASYLPHFTKS